MDVNFIIVPRFVSLSIFACSSFNFKIPIGFRILILRHTGGYTYMEYMESLDFSGANLNERCEAEDLPALHWLAVEVTPSAVPTLDVFLQSSTVD